MAIARSAHGARRAEVLAWLERATDPVSVADLARGTDLHVNTARFHLDRLVENGLAERQTEPAVARGRPRILYSARPPEPDPRSYRLIAALLTDIVSALDPDQARVQEVGQAWGRQLAVDAPGAGEGSLEHLGVALGALGFEQAHESDAAGERLAVTHCPVRDLAGQHPEVLCTAHRGLIEGALDALSIPLEVAELHPFITPNTCVATLRATLGQ